MLFYCYRKINKSITKTNEKFQTIMQKPSIIKENLKINPRI